MVAMLIATSSCRSGMLVTAGAGPSAVTPKAKKRSSMAKPAAF
jgi:hypothetical protein